MLSLVIKSISGVHSVIPQVKVVVVVDTELGSILLEQLVDVNHTVLVFLSGLPLRQAPQVLNFLTLRLIIGDLALQPALHLIFADVGELMSWQQPRE